MPTGFEVDSRSLLARACDPGCNPSHHDAHPRFDQSGGRSADFGALSHDVRSTLATLALHLDALKRLTGPGGAKAASAAHALVSEAAGVCTEALQEAINPDASPQRLRRCHGYPPGRGVSPADRAGEFFDQRESRRADHSSGQCAAGFPHPFQPCHNAVMVARRTQRLSRLDFVVERAAATVVQSTTAQAYQRRSAANRSVSRAVASPRGAMASASRLPANWRSATAELLNLPSAPEQRSRSCSRRWRWSHSRTAASRHCP